MNPRARKIRIWIFGIFCSLPVLYYLSLGPVGWLCHRGYLPDEPFQSFYRELIIEDICGAERYYNWWVPPEPFYCGTSDMSVSSGRVTSTANTNR